jgi:hypothetical protein
MRGGKQDGESAKQNAAKALADNPEADPKAIQEAVEQFVTPPPTQAEQTAIDRLQWDKDKVAHDRAIALGEKTINGTGWVTKTSKGREELSAKLGKHEEATILIDKLTSDSIGWANSKWPSENKARWAADVVLLKAALAKTIVGQGAISEPEWDMIDKVIGNPTSATSFVGQAKAKLKELQETIDERRIIAIKAEVNNLTEESDLSYSYGAKEKEKEEEGVGLTIIDVGPDGELNAQLGAPPTVTTKEAWGGMRW